MRGVIVIVTAATLCACAPTQPKYTPRLPCPDLPELSATPTRAELEQHDLKVVQMYGECRKARRVNPRVVQSEGS